MHALLATFQMDPARLAENTDELRERIIPMVKHQPGFVSGHWSYDRARSRYHSFIAFAREEDARGLHAFLATQVANQRDGGVVFESASVVEVLGHAVAP